MILTKLTLNDFGVFRGSQSISLAPQRSKPIVLFGGKNGAGKSTLLEAIRLCLYGRSSLGDRVRLVDYRTYLSDRIHRSSQLGYAPHSAEVALEFEHVEVGVQH